MLAVPLLLLFLLALPVGLVPVQLVLGLGVQLLWQERLQGEAKRTDSVTLVQTDARLPVPPLSIFHRLLGRD